MSPFSLYDVLHKMKADDIILAYKGEINTELLEAVYSMVDSHLEERKTPAIKKKKIFHILVESLQNVFHHQVVPSELKSKDDAMTGFIIKREGVESYQVITGNYLHLSVVEGLKEKIEKVNSLSSEDLKTHYQNSLAEGEFSEKGGAGLGILDIARKSGRKLVYDFTKIDDEYSFFSLTITIP